MRIIEKRQDRLGKPRLALASSAPGEAHKAIDVSTVRYRCVHQRKPRGYRLWYFAMPDGLTFSYIGSYSEAKRAAAAQACTKYRESNICIQLCA